MCTADDPIHVIVWDEQQPKQKQAYENFLGNEIADYLKKQQGLVVRSVRLDDAEQGLSESNLNNCEVLIWWGHVRQLDVSEETGRKIVDRIKAGNLSLIALHSAHWSTPFVEAMQERTRMDARKQFPQTSDQRVQFEFIKPKNRFIVPKADDPLTPSFYPRKFPDGSVRVQVKLPLCIFPAYRADGKPSQIRTLKPDHPIARGIPAFFTLPGTEMYDEPYHIPEPDELIFEERWEPGEWFRSGCVWNLGKGKVFYFRPGHETFPVFKNENARQIIENAVRYLASCQREKQASDPPAAPADRQ
ncbi:MAG: ThuA domain-containing protein [Planctomycetota bacterium]|nr:ThuA domain-containing protein [Planctomycetota bacterium]